MSLEIKEVKITDSISERAKTCMLSLAPAEVLTGPVAGVQFPGDTNIVSGGNIRPNNTSVAVVCAYGGLPAHTVFAGYVENMDDLEDPDQYVYEINLSAMPATQNHRTRLSRVTNQTAVNGAATWVVNNTKDTEGNITGSLTLPAPNGQIRTVHQVLQKCCDIVGIPMGRIDLPDHHVWGTYEIVRQNIMEIAEAFCAPFNMFEFQRYFVRCDERDGLQIIKLDYTLGGEVTNPYVLSNVLAKKRGFSRYMPDNRIGNSDIVLSGAEIYGNDALDSALGNIANLTPLPGDDLGPIRPPKQPRTTRDTYVHTYVTDSAKAEYGGAPKPRDSQTISSVTVEYTLERTYNPESTDTNQVNVPPTPEEPGSEVPDPPDFLQAVNDLLAGKLASIQIINSKVTTITNEVYEASAAGSDLQLVATTVTENTYEKLDNDQNTAAQPLEKKDVPEVLMYSVTVETQYANGQEFPVTMTKHWHHYNDLGVEDSVSTAMYKYVANEWKLYESNVENQSEQATQNAEIQRYANELAASQSELREKAEENQQRWDEAYNKALSHGYGPADAQRYADSAMGDGLGSFLSNYLGRRNVFQTTPQDTNVPASVSREPVVTGQYRLVNGIRVSTTNSGAMAPEGQLESAGASRLPVANGSYMTDARLRSAFHLSAEWMDFTGLTLLHNLAQRQRELEKAGAYWESVQVTTPIDSTPAAGGSVALAGSTGFAEQVVHTLTEDEALTTTGMRRLVW